MVKRWHNWCEATHQHLMGANSTGNYVEYSDYLSLQAALREALDMAEGADMTKQEGERLWKLRKQFLDI